MHTETAITAKHYALRSRERYRLCIPEGAPAARFATVYLLSEDKKLKQGDAIASGQTGAL